MHGQAVPTGIDGLLMPAGATIFLGELRKRNRRRIVLDPASKIVKTRVVRHSATPEGRGYGVTVM